MRSPVAWIGLVLILAATSVQAVARHDGVLGVTAPEAFPAPGHSETVRARLVVDGTPATSASYVGDLAARGMLATNLASITSGPTYVTAHFDRPGADTIVLLRVQGPVPAIGDVVVVEGQAETFLVAPNGASAPLLWLDAREVQAPILFKRE